MGILHTRSASASSHLGGAIASPSRPVAARHRSTWCRMARVGALAAPLLVATLAASGCREPKEAAYAPSALAIGADPDKVYAAAVRVFVRRGWGLVERDANARALETGWFAFRDIGVDAPRKLRGSFRILVGRGVVDVFTRCGKLKGQAVDASDDACEDDRPLGIKDRERQLVEEILAEVQRQGLERGELQRGLSRDDDAPAERRKPKPKVERCKEDDDCSGGKVCDADGMCVKP
jgi:hypothetical protein